MHLDERDRVMSGGWFRRSFGLPARLTNEEERAEVERIRRDSLRLKELRNRLGDLLAGQRCLVLGSAPGATRPDMSRMNATICINGSGWTAREMGVDKPSLTVFSSRNTRPDKLVREATMSVLNGLKTDHLLLIDVADEMEVARAAIDAAGLQYDQFSCVTPLERAAIVGEVCGIELGLGIARDRISNGVFAITLPIWAGAFEVVLAGFSTGGGHAYLDTATGRGHLTADTEFFKLAPRLKCRITTTSQELQNRFGLKLSP